MKYFNPHPSHNIPQNIWYFISVRDGGDVRPPDNLSTLRHPRQAPPHTPRPPTFPGAFRVIYDLFFLISLNFSFFHFVVDIYSHIYSYPCSPSLPGAFHIWSLSFSNEMNSCIWFLAHSLIERLFLSLSLTFTAPTQYVHFLFPLI